MTDRSQAQQVTMLLGLVFILVGILSLKLVGPYMEYFKIKAAVLAIAQDKAKTTSVGEVRKAFDARATIDDIASVKASDLEITKEGGDVVIAFSYRKEVPMFANVGMFVDFSGNSKGE